jgi:glycosyltransferase involved in cell wall biosynthesis
VRVCIVYDCLYPWTVGGAERWYRNLAERLAGDGHDVTYLTRLQWEPAHPPAVAGVRVLAVSGADPLYGEDGNRRIAPPLRFGRGVLRHLWRHGDRYDVVHTGSFPYFSLLAAGLARRRRGFHLVVDWIEVWSRAYWREYLGPVAGAIGHEVQRACVRIPQQAFCFSRLVRDRLLEEGLRSAPEILSGIYAGPLTPPEPNHAERVVVFAGRHIPEKRAPAVVPAVRLAREQVPGLRGTVFGDGPERPAVVEAIAREGVAGVVEAPGFVNADEIDVALRDALCMLLPSVREGYGLIVVESAAHGTPSVVVRSPDNAAVELVEDGVNGVVAESDDPRDLAAAIVRVHAAGDPLRASTCAWFAQHAPRLSLGRALEQVSARYGRRELSARA